MLWLKLDEHDDNGSCVGVLIVMATLYDDLHPAAPQSPPSASSAQPC
jgi:hypothetical protein